MSLPWSLSWGRYIAAESVADGAVIPWWLGVAWYCPYSQSAYCLPIPLHWVIGGFRHWWIQARRPCPWEPDPIMVAMRIGREEGYREGRINGEAFVLGLKRDGLLP